ncbi:hypothetical protein V7094_28550 [Priestia megaterium]|uniref:hypothetical protein n=1 Tax=Priestia megaterium TaxID=1404 RepID=UPI0030004B2B
MNKEKFVSRMGRTVEKNMLVGVHWNVRLNAWSIVQFKSRHAVGLVLGYASEITLRDVTTHINKSTQKKVIESPTGAKDRHAFIVGYLVDLEYRELERNVYYKPQAVKDFVDAEKYFNGTVEYIDHVDSVSMSYNHEKNHPLVKYNKAKELQVTSA